MSNQIVVWITKYWQTGIRPATVEIDEDMTAYGSIGNSFAWRFAPKDYALTKEDALEQIEAKRIKKIAALKRQIIRLEQFEPCFVEE